MLPILHVGGHLIVMRNFARREFLELASRERITHALMVPAMYSLCLLEPDLGGFDLSAWRLGVYGGAPMPEPTIRRFAAAVPHLAMCNAYGATETTSPATIMPPGDGIAHTDSIGKVVPCGDIRVMDEQQHEVPPGEDGELWIAGPMIVPGYWRNPAATSRQLRRRLLEVGRYRLGRCGGLVRIADRKKDMIIRGGFKVYPAEVENVLCDQDGVVEAAVVGQPDSVLGRTRRSPSCMPRPRCRTEVRDVLRRADGGLQGAGLGGRLRRAAAPQRQRQDPEGPAPAPGRAGSGRGAPSRRRKKMSASLRRTGRSAN